MHEFCDSNEQMNLIKYMSDFGNTPIKVLLPKGLKKYGLNKLRWVLTDFGVCHYHTPDMPIMDYMMMAASLEEQITNAESFNVTIFYRLLAARNILKLLNRAYNFNDAVKNFFGLNFVVVLNILEVSEYLSPFTSEELLLRLSIAASDSIKNVTDVLLDCIEPIINLCNHKISICERLTNGPDKEQNILYAYEIYQLLFLILFSLELPSDYSYEYLNERYHTRGFKDIYYFNLVDTIRSWNERSNNDED